ncbi:MAG: hypothetical protein ACREYC_17235, partial [Gammaproteobacteria bacterium]
FRPDRRWHNECPAAVMVVRNTSIMRTFQNGLLLLLLLLCLAVGGYAGAEGRVCGRDRCATGGVDYTLEK